MGRDGSGQGQFDPGEGLFQARNTQSLDDVHSRREYATPALSTKPMRADAFRVHALQTVRTKNPLPG